MALWAAKNRVIVAFIAGNPPRRTFMDGYNEGTLIEHVSGLGYLTHEQLQQKDDACILDRWRCPDD